MEGLEAEVLFLEHMAVYATHGIVTTPVSIYAVLLDIHRRGHSVPTSYPRM